MSRAERACLTIRALGQLFLYDLINGTLGFKRVHRVVARQHVVKREPQAGMEVHICDAVTLASCFYWRPVFCLQRSFAATLLLRKYGIAGSLVIGYRPAPFFSHAWVEVEGRVVNDSSAYKERLQILCTV